MPLFIDRVLREQGTEGCLSALLVGCDSQSETIGAFGTVSDLTGLGGLIGGHSFSFSCMLRRACSVVRSDMWMGSRFLIGLLQSRENTCMIIITSYRFPSPPVAGQRHPGTTENGAIFDFDSDACDDTCVVPYNIYRNALNLVV